MHALDRDGFNGSPARVVHPTSSGMFAARISTLVDRMRRRKRTILKSKSPLRFSGQGTVRKRASKGTRARTYVHLPTTYATGRCLSTHPNVPIDWPCLARPSLTPLLRHGGSLTGRPRPPEPSHPGLQGAKERAREAHHHLSMRPPHSILRSPPPRVPAALARPG